MLMVILGAGASYDSAQAYRIAPPAVAMQTIFPRSDFADHGGPWRPPLAKDLFLDKQNAMGSIVDKYPKLSHVISYLREPSTRSVEQVLESLQKESEGDPETQRELLSVRFYLQELLTKVTEEWTKRTNGVTNYAPLVRELLRQNRSDEQILLVTFNYDLLLDRALTTFGYAMKDPDQHLTAHPNLKLFKLHGSVNWSRIVRLDSSVRMAPQGLIEHAERVEMTARFVLANAIDPYQMHAFGSPIIPAIAIPVQTKSGDSFECPRGHLTYLADRIPEVTKILIIGWQAKESHFLEILGTRLERLEHLMCVDAAEADARRVAKYFCEQIQKDIPNPIPGRGGFTDFIVNREGQHFFSL